MSELHSRRIHKVHIRTDLVSPSIIEQSLADKNDYLWQTIVNGCLYGENYSIFNGEFSRGFIPTNHDHVRRFVTIDPTMATHRINNIYKDDDGKFVADIEILDPDDEAEIESSRSVMQLMPRALIGTRTRATRIITFDLLVLSPTQADSIMQNPERIEVMIANEASYFRDDWARLRSELKIMSTKDPRRIVHMESDIGVVAFEIKDWRSTNDHKLYATVKTSNFIVYSILKNNPERACNHMIFIWAGHEMTTFAQTAENKYLSKILFSIDKHQGATSKNLTMDQMV